MQKLMVVQVMTVIECAFADLYSSGFVARNTSSQAVALHVCIHTSALRKIEASDLQLYIDIPLFQHISHGRIEICGGHIEACVACCAFRAAWT